MPPEDHDGPVQDDAVTVAMPDHRATVRAGLQRGAASLDGHNEEWAGEIALPNEGVYLPGGLWRGRAGDPRRAYEAELWGEAGAMGGYERVALLESRLSARLPVLRRELERHLERFVSYLEPEKGVWTDELLGVIAEHLAIRAAGRKAGCSSDEVAHAELVEAVRRADESGDEYVGDELALLADLIQHQGAASNLLDALDTATTFESAASRWAAAWRVLGAFEAFGPTAREIGVSMSSVSAGDSPLGWSGAGREAEERVVKMGIELIKLAEAGEVPDFNGGTDTGLIDWCGKVIGMQGTTARTVLQQTGVIVKGEGKQGATGRSLGTRLSRLFQVVRYLRPDLRERAENAEIVVLGHFSADSYSGAATEEDG